MGTWTVLKDLTKKNCLIKNVFTEKDGKTGENGEELGSHISGE